MPLTKIGILASKLLEDDSQIKPIRFPHSEIPVLAKQHRLYTTRVSSDFNTYATGDKVLTPWGKLMHIKSRRVYSNIEKHPFHDELTRRQLALIAKYPKYSVLEIADKS